MDETFLIKQLKTVKKTYDNIQKIATGQGDTAKLVVNWFLHNMLQRTLKTKYNRFNQTTSS